MPYEGSAASTAALAVAVGDGGPGRQPEGLSAADVVVEELDGGAHHRLLAIFQSRTATRVAPVSDLRLTDIQLLQVLHPVLVFQAAPAAVLDAARAARLSELSPNGTGSSAYTTSPAGLVADVAALMARATATRSTSEGFLTFASEGQPLARQGVSTALTAKVDVPGTTSQTWTYNVGTDRWRGVADEFGSFDAANLVVQFVDYRTLGKKHADGVPIRAAKVSGRGRCVAFSSGLRSDCGWVKPGAEAVTVYSDGTGVPLRFSPGPTWIVLVPGEAVVGSSLS